MIIRMDMLCRVFSRALDIIEEEQIGASEYHSMRTAALCLAMGKHLGYDSDTLSALAVSALFHDNALTEYHLSKHEVKRNGENMKLHCKKGQENVSWLPFKSDASGFVLYHHEREKGDGPFGKREGEFPFEAALLAAADSVDVTYRLSHVREEELTSLRDEIMAYSDEFSTRAAVSVLYDVLNSDVLESLRDENISRTLDASFLPWEVDVAAESVIGIAKFIAHIIDYKSEFTRRHTSQIANRAWLMGESYGYLESELAAIYLAASLHDIGKIATPTEVLEKPGKLNREEFDIIKLHVKHTHDWLCDMPGFELIRNWAADHHEKMNGTGYTFGKKGDELDFNSRLMACIDIYQAVSEMRPYHDARSHAETMPFLYDMARKGLIDGSIAKDMDGIMEEYSLRDVPAPN